MSFQIKITHTALKQYNKINEPSHSQIRNRIDTLAEFGLESTNIKALTGEFKGSSRAIGVSSHFNLNPNRAMV